MNIGSFVRQKRREKNLSQSQLAELAAVGLNFVYQLEKNKQTVQLNCARQVLLALGYDFDFKEVESDHRIGASFADPKSFELPW